MNENEFEAEAKRLMGLAHQPPRSDWERHRISLLNHVAQGDDKSDFLHWSTIQATMFVGNVPYVQAELREILSDNDIGRWIRAMSDSRFGNPDRLPNDQRFTGSSVHQTYHLRVWERAVGRHIHEVDHIIEFGGGYGQMCAIAHRLGFSGRYTLFDLPEFLLLQRYYLENVLPHISDGGVANLSYMQVDGEDRFQMPPDGSDLLIGCYSLCEASATLRNIFFDVVKPKSCLIATHDTWGGVDMHKDYDQFMRARQKYYVWHKRDNKNIPGHFYVIGDAR